jgi:tetratricopeptide (TPR) repeat protein
MENTYIDFLHHDPDAAAARLPDFYARLRDVLAWNASSPDRAYANWPLWATSVECNVADTLVQAGRFSEAEELLHRTRKNMVQNDIQDDVLWDSWYFSRARLENRQGNYDWAYFHLQQMGGWFFDPADYAAELEKARRGMAAPHSGVKRVRPSPEGAIAKPQDRALRSAK